MASSFSNLAKILSERIPYKYGHDHRKCDLAKFLSAPEYAWKVALNKIKVELDVSTDINMLLKV